MRMQPFQSIVAEIELKKVNKIISKRNKNAQFLDKELSDINFVKVPKRIVKFKETFALYMARFDKRDQLKKFLKNGIEVKVPYPVPLHLQVASKKLGYKIHDFPESESQAKDLLTLPVHQYLSKKQLKYMVDKIKLFYK